LLKEIKHQCIQKGPVLNSRLVNYLIGPVKILDFFQNSNDQCTLLVTCNNWQSISIYKI